jgi:hypothetical protein
MMVHNIPTPFLVRPLWIPPMRLSSVFHLNNTKQKIFSLIS